MKRKRPATFDWELIHVTKVAEKLHAVREFIGKISPMSRTFVVVRGPITGIFNTWHEVEKHKLHLKGCVYKKFNHTKNALDWYESSLKISPIDHPDNIKVHLGYYNGDITQDKDRVCVVAAKFLHPTYKHLDFCVPGNMFCKNVQYHLVTRVLELMPDNVPISTIINSYRIAYHLNYGLNAWPARTLDFNYTDPNIAWLKREIDKRTGSTAIDWADSEFGNRAHKEAISQAMKHYRRGISFYRCIRKREAITWILIAKRVGVVPDIRRKIARMLYNRCINVNDPTNSIPFLV